MQPQNPLQLPISAFLSEFPVEMRSVEDPSWQSRHAPVQTNAGIVEDPGFDFQAYANLNLNTDATSSQSGQPMLSQNTDQTGAPKTGDIQTVGRVDNYTGYAPASAAIQDTTYALGSTPSHTGAQSDNMTIQSAYTTYPNPVQTHPSVPTTSEVYKQLEQGPANLSSPYGHHSYNVQDDSSLPSGMSAGPSTPNLSQVHHHGLGVSASVVVTGLPAFNIPIDVAIILSNMYRQ